MQAHRRVYYLPGEEFDRDPFLIFKLRGMERSEFVALVGESAAQPGAPAHTAAPFEPLPASASEFWAARELPADVTGAAPSSPAGAALARRPGKFPFWRGGEDLQEFLEAVYAQAAAYTATTLERG